MGKKGHDKGENEDNEDIKKKRYSSSSEGT